MVQCSQGVNNYCKRVQSQNNSTIIRVYCLTGGCSTNSQMLWLRIDLSPRGMWRIICSLTIYTHDHVKLPSMLQDELYAPLIF